MATSSDTVAYTEATEKARAVRAIVAQQASELIVECDMTGARGRTVRCIRAVVDAETTGDRVVLRSALMELISATGGWVAGIDLE